jgi:hypothetical protein
VCLIDRSVYRHQDAPTGEEVPNHGRG